MQTQAAQDLSQLNVATTMQMQKFPVGGKLAALVKTLPARTWMTALSGDREGRKMRVEATYLINPESPYEFPTKKWIEALKADPSFRYRLKRVDLGNSSQKVQGKVELFSFDLTAEWER